MYLIQRVSCTSSDNGFALNRMQAITRPSDDPVHRRHMASLGHNGLTHCGLVTPWGLIKFPQHYPVKIQIKSENIFVDDISENVIYKMVDILSDIQVSIINVVQLIYLALKIMAMDLVICYGYCATMSGVFHMIRCKTYGEITKCTLSHDSCIDFLCSGRFSAPYVSVYRFYVSCYEHLPANTIITPMYLVSIYTLWHPAMKNMYSNWYCYLLVRRTVYPLWQNIFKIIWSIRTWVITTHFCHMDVIVYSYHRCSVPVLNRCRQKRPMLARCCSWNSEH